MLFSLSNTNWLLNVFCAWLVQGHCILEILEILEPDRASKAINVPQTIM